jgi:hypothetical protein
MQVGTEDNAFSPRRTLEALRRRIGTVTWIVLKHLEYLGYEFKPATNNQQALKLVSLPPEPEDLTEQQIYHLFNKPGYQLFLQADRSDPGLYHARWVEYTYKLDTESQGALAHPVPGTWPNADTPYVIGALSAAHADKMGILAEFCDLVAIGYRDLGKAEEYYFHKQGRVLVLKVVYNEQDGGFLIIDKIITGEGTPLDIST